jgi:hypothetical protein
MSLVKANTYQDASGGSNAVFSGVASPPNSMGFRNRIINGAMMIDQRNAGASTTPSGSSAGTYTVDRWVYQASATGKFTVQQNLNSVTPPAGFKNYLGLSSTAATAVGAADYYNIYQCIEGFNIADLGFGAAGATAITLSFWVRSSLTGTFGGSVRNGAVNRSYPFNYTISAANTWEYKTVAISGDTTGTWASDNSGGMYITWSLGTGSNFSGGTVNAWNAANYQAPASPQSVVSTNGATFYITGVQLEAGTNASAFERRDYGRELIMCQRYYQLYSGVYGSAGGSTVVYAVFQLPVTMRSGPTATVSNALAMTFPGVAAYTQSSANVSAAGSSSTTSVFLSLGNFSGLTTGNPITMNGTSQFVQLSAEL